jgi:hypothetical protein
MTETTTADEGTPASAWWQGEAFQPYSEFLTAKGLTIDDPAEAAARAVKGWQSAEKHLGRPADALIQKPKEGQALAEWMRENAGIFGLPESPEKYELKAPKMPEGVGWDATLEAKARAVAHANGVPPAALQAMTEVYAAHIGEVAQEAQNGIAAANQAMLADLMKDWGHNTPHMMAVAQQAAQAIGQKAGLSPEGLAGVAMVLKEKVGDAGVMKIFATIGEMMGEDTLQTGGTQSLGMTPQQAAAQLRAMDAPDGEYGRAYARGDRAEMARLQDKRNALIRIAAPTMAS